MIYNSNMEKLKERLLIEENKGIDGWDFSYIDGKYEQEELPWNYKDIVCSYLKDDMKVLDMDTGGGEFLLSLKHPYENTYAIESYAPNVLICKEKLIPLGIHFKECRNNKIPFEDESFDLIINRHGSYDICEIKRCLKKDGIFITQQVGEDNDVDLVQKVLPKVSKSFSGMNLKQQVEEFEKENFVILGKNEFYGSIKFFDIAAFTWFASIIKWEFVDFSVEKCFKKLIEVNNEIEKYGFVEGEIHRYLIISLKK